MSNVQNPAAEPTQTSVLTETLLQPLGVADAVRGASQNFGESEVFSYLCDRTTSSNEPQALFCG